MTNLRPRNVAAQLQAFVKCCMGLAATKSLWQSRHIPSIDVEQGLQLSVGTFVGCAPNPRGGANPHMMIQSFVRSLRAVVPIGQRPDPALLPALRSSAMQSLRR